MALASFASACSRSRDARGELRVHQNVAAAAAIRNVAPLDEPGAALRVGLDLTDTVIFVQDRELRYTQLSRPCLGYAVEEVIGRTDEDLLPSQVVEQVVAL